MSELKPCPFCKAELEQFNAVAVAHPSCGTGYCLLSGRVLVPSEFDRFNRRPIEDELRATIRKMDQEHTQSLDGKLAMVGKLEELEGLRKKLSRAYYHLRRVIGDHNAPGDCYSTGPHEGNAMDHICPSCAALRELGKELKGHQ